MLLVFQSSKHPKAPRDTCPCECVITKQYIFLIHHHVILGKILEIIGLLLIGGTVYSFIGMTESELRWPIFWGCAAGALGIIIYRNYMKKRKKNT
tara:strand:+ start:1376 stop:1660 length:285 start_codon:yes stop_codon:yes gene_type:complete